MRDHGDGGAAADGCRAHLRQALRAVYPGRYRRRGRPRHPGSQPEGEAVSKREGPAKGNGASSTGNAETAELEPKRAATAESLEAKAEADALPTTLSNGQWETAGRKRANSEARIRSTCPMLSIEEFAARKRQADHGPNPISIGGRGSGLGLPEHAA